MAAGTGNEKRSLGSVGGGVENCAYEGKENWRTFCVDEGGFDWPGVSVLDCGYHVSWGEDCETYCHVALVVEGCDVLGAGFGYL